MSGKGFRRGFMLKPSKVLCAEGYVCNSVSLACGSCGYAELALARSLLVL